MEIKNVGNQELHKNYNFMFYPLHSSLGGILDSFENVTFADYYLRANIVFQNKACTRGRYYSYTGVYFLLFVFIYVYRHIYVCHVLAVALASLP